MQLGNKTAKQQVKANVRATDFVHDQLTSSRVPLVAFTASPARRRETAGNFQLPAIQRREAVQQSEYPALGQSNVLGQTIQNDP